MTYVNTQFDIYVYHLYCRLRTLGSNNPMIDKLTSDNVSCQSTASVTGSPQIARLHRYTSNPLQSKVETTNPITSKIMQKPKQAIKHDNNIADLVCELNDNKI